MNNAKRLTKAEIDARVVIKPDSSIKFDGVNGVMLFGADNDYPQMMELGINGSSSAKAAANVYSKFLGGEGFVNENINEIVVGKDQRGKDITARDLLRQICASVSKNQGFYVHRNVNKKGETGTVHLKPFKNCRFSTPDGRGYSAKILVHDNWGKDKDLGKFKKEDVVSYGVFSNDINVISAQYQGDDNFKGQIYFQFLDNEYFYPLNTFDECYLDVDSDQQLALYKNRQLRNSFFEKILARVQPGITTTDENGNEIENGGVADDLIGFLGADAETVMVIEDDINPDTNEFYKNSFQLENIKGNADPKLFDGFESSIPNNIRKAVNNLPNLLVEISDGIFSGQSGEAIKQATAFYNAMTDDDRALISKSFGEIFETSSIPELRDNKDWSIQPLTLIKEEVQAEKDEAEIKRLESQATLKGSVGGVTALIQLQQSVANGSSDLNAAIEIVKEIYGISEEIARKMIGTPKNTEDDTITQPGTATGN